MRERPVALARGPLPLASALWCGSEVARRLHELHLESRAHGKLTTSSVLLRPTTVELLPARNLREPATAEDDVRAFGAVLYQMLTGTKAPEDASEAHFSLPDAPSGLSEIRSAA